MKRIEKKNTSWLYYFLAFILPFFGMCIMMIVRGFEPFGPVSMLYSDMYHQYYPFFLSFRKALLSGESLLYCWDVGMGMDYLGLIAYYLASPLNLLSILIPEGWTLEYFSLLMPLKVGFAGLFFAIFLKKLYGKTDLSLPLFGCFYALCAWTTGYQWNIMWLDTFALLPLVALGTISLLRDKKVLLYTVTLTLSVAANYYIGLFTCIFVALLFLCYEISRWEGFEKFFRALGRIALFSILAIGMTAILELPAFAALQTTQSSVNKFPSGFKLNIADENTWIGLLDAMRQVAGNMNGGITPTFKEGLPNLYCGLLTNLLAILFLTCKEVRLRDKICSVALLIFFNLSFILRQLDYIWHGFHFTNMIPYRFSFLYSFVLLYMAYRAYLLRDSFKIWQIIVAGILACGLVFCCETTDAAYWAYNTVFLTLYITIMILPHLFLKKGTEENDIDIEKETLARRKVCAFLTAGVMVLELGLTILNFGINFTGTIVTDYPRGTADAAAAIANMKEREEGNLFYRAETTHSQTLNDGAINGYHGISTFTSSANVRVTEFMQALGYGAKNTYNRYCFEESSPVANLFLNLKYMIERQGQVKENIYFEDVFNSGKVHLLENKAYLPLGFMVKNQVLNLEVPKQRNTFPFQNTILQEAAGIQDDVWLKPSDDALTITGDNVTIRSQTKGGYSSYETTADSNGTLIYSYTSDLDGLFCVDLNLPKKNNFSVYKNDELLYSETYSLPQSLSVAQVVPGDVIEIHFTCKKAESSNITVHARVLDQLVFQEAYEYLNQSTLELKSFERTKIQGTVDCKEAGILYTSIPQDGNWTATVDGHPVEPVTLFGSMVGLALPEGQHEITFQYHNKAFEVGCVVSAICLIVFIALYIGIYTAPQKKSKTLK